MKDKRLAIQSIRPRRNQFAISRRLLKAAALVALILGTSAIYIRAASVPETSAPGANSQSGSDLLLFLDGGSLHGDLKAMDTQHGIQWQHPDAKQVIKFNPRNIATIKFDNPKRVNSDTQPRCWFQFANGDQLFGDLKSLDTDKVQLETWFGGNLEAPRQALRAVTFFSKGYSILYEGPTGTNDWKMDQGPRGWNYRDGAFVANSAGILGRNLKLSGSSTVEFDLAWNGHFSMSFILYTDSFERFDYSSSSYMFHLAPGYINLQRIQTGAGVSSLGQAQIPNMLKRERMHLEIRSNKEDATIAVLADGVLVHRWKDHSGFVGRGSCVVFSSQMDGPVIKLSNIKVAEWDGAQEPQPEANLQAKEDMVLLANRDKVTGNLESIQDGKLNFALPKNKLAIPMDRITQIVFQSAATNAPASNPWEMQVDVSGGGSVTFQLENWTQNQVLGQSAIFGRMTVNPESIRQIQFNSPHLRMAAENLKAAGEQNFEIDE